MDIGYTLRILLVMAAAAALMVLLFLLVENGLRRGSRHRDRRQHPPAPVEHLPDADEGNH